MFVQIQKGSSTPISRQIAEQIRAQCAAGGLQSGDRLPSVRQLARQLTVNQNTILRVYERLSADGVLEVRHGEGTFVAGGAQKRQFDRQHKQWVNELQLVVRRGVLLGIAPEEQREIFGETLSEATRAIR